jgi:transcriptional/translational regulatory protein YebC/TACO1
MDAKTNIVLQRVLKEANSIKLPKENIDRAMKKASDSMNEDYSTGLYEIYGHGGPRSFTTRIA